MLDLPQNLMGIGRNTQTEMFVKETKKTVSYKKRNEDKACIKIKQVRNIYSICNGVFMYTQRQSFPKTLLKRKLSDFHVCHASISRVNALMRSYIFLRKMNKGIENLVKSCRSDLVATLPNEENVECGNQRTPHTISLKHI